MPMTLVRKMQSRDVKRASKVTREVMLESWEKREKDYYPRRALDFDMSTHSPEYYRTFLKADTNFVFVAEEKDEVIGLAQGSILGESGLARLIWMGVHSAHQNKGVGRALLEKVMEHCKSKGCHKITLYTLPVLTPAINLYLKCGFVPEAYLPKEWWGVDFIKMSKWL